jgi:predicted transcriptional regulator
MAQFLLRGFRRPREAVESALGALERQVLERCWSLGREVSVRELVEAFDGALAYTTLMTTVDRLYKKRLLDRRREGRAFLYTARVSEDQLRRGVAADVIDSLLGEHHDEARPVMSTFVDALGERDRALLDELEELIRRRRAGRVKRES